MRVFISYSHDSTRHDARVLELSNRLRTESNIECRIDQHEVSPPEGWPKWMDRHVAESDFVLVVCTETYKKRVDGKELPGRGLGVRWESTLIYQTLYDAGAENTRFVPVVFSEDDVQFIPKPLGGATRIDLGKSDGYQQLVSRLYNISPADAPPVAAPLSALPARPEFFQPPANNLPQAGVARNLDFVGREKQLQELYRALSKHNVAVNQAVSGEGGVGKSQLAAEFAFRFAGDFGGLWWLDASETAIETAVSALAEAMGIRAAPDTPPDQLRQAICRRLSSGKHLLVLDNLEKPERLREFLVSAPSRILATTRRTDLPTDLIETQLLEVLALDEAVALLRLHRPDLAGDGCREALERLAEHLGRHSLTVALAAGYLRRFPDIMPPQLLEMLERAEVGQSGYVLDDLEPQHHAAGYGLKVAACLGLHLPKLDATPGGKIVALAAFCHPKAIPVELFVTASAKDGLTAQQVREELAQLRDWSIFKYEGSIEVHRLTQSLVRGQLGEEGRRAILIELIAILADVFQSVVDDIRRLPTQDLYASHAVEAVEHAERIGKIPLTASLANQTGLYFWNRARLDASLAMLRTAERIDRAAFGDEHPEVAINVNNIGRVLHDKGDLEGALRCYREAERIDRVTYGDEHSAVARDVNNIGRVLHDKGDLDGALRCLREAERIDRAAFGDDHPKVALRVNNIGGVLKAKGDLDGALQCYREAERIDRAAFGDEHPAVARDVNNIGTVLSIKGDLEGELRCYHEAERIDRAAFGDDHPAVARAVNNIGSVLSTKGDLEGARKCYREGFRICIRLLGPRALETLTGAQNLRTVGVDPIALAREAAGAEAAEELARLLDG